MAERIGSGLNQDIQKKHKSMILGGGERWKYGLCECRNLKNCLFT